MNGQAHFVGNLTLQLSGFAVLAYMDSPLLPLAMTGLTLGLVITPDYDFKRIYIKAAIQRVPLIGALWFTYWWPYAVMFSHRGLSHNVLLGTLTRALYLCAAPLSLILYFNPHYLLSVDYTNLLWILAFWYMQDILHLIMDLSFFNSSEN